MENNKWLRYAGGPDGKVRVIADLVAKRLGKVPSYEFTEGWFKDKDPGDTNFKKRVEILLGPELFKLLTEKTR